MAVKSILNYYELENGNVLSPERYNPLRIKAKLRNSISIMDFVQIKKENISPKNGSNTKSYIVFDTGDASNGLLNVNKATVSISKIGSNKKVIKPGDLIISRLRPYLKQVAYVDGDIYKYFAENPIMICSTEFYVLTPNNNTILAFLVPYLLSEYVQEILSVSQEGGHHPRFNQATLENLSVPKDLVLQKDKLNTIILNSISNIRTGDIAIKKIIKETTNKIGTSAN